MRNIKKYLSFFKIRFLAGLQYRISALAGIITQLAWGAMSILLYYAFYKSGNPNFPMEFSSLSTYIWLQQATFTMFALWFFDEDIFASISSGNIAYEFSRPCDIYAMWMVKNMALRLSRVALRSLPMIVVAVLLPYPFNLAAPESLVSGLLFFVSLVLAFVVVVAFLMLIYISAFYTVSAMGTRIIATTLGDFLAGSIIPIPFFPEAVQPFFYALPFAYMQSAPFLIYTGEMGGKSALLLILGQLFWAVLLILVGRLILSHAERRVAVQGG